MKPEKEHTRFVTAIFLMIFFICLIMSIVFFEDSDTTRGFIYLICSIIFMSISIWTYYNPFYPVLIGLVISIIFSILLIYHFPEQIIGDINKERIQRKPIIYIGITLAVIIHALVKGYKEWKTSKLDSK